MGTHPIFESDFDCLTEWEIKGEMDEVELEELKSRIETRKQMREEQMRLRAEREKERQAAEEAARKLEEEQKKKDAMTALSASFGGYKSQAQKRTGNREKKKKVLAERRKPLNIDHLDGDKVRAKINEMYKYLCQIESERIEAEHAYEPGRHEVTVMRNRVNMTMQRMQKKKK